MIIGIDIGGTFTDLVSSEDGEIRTVKVPSTPDDFSEGFSSALSVATSDPGAIEEIVHATTVATNALIQRKGARVGLITTKGFRDILALRRRDRGAAYGIQTRFEPLVPRELRREVSERASPTEVVNPVDPDELSIVAQSLWDDGAEAILVAFLHALTCPDNERLALDTLTGRWPDKPIFASHVLSDAATEFERFSTGAASAYVAPLVRSYLSGIGERLDRPETLRVVVSDGGLVSADEAEANPVRTALSGPAAGVWGARAVCEAIEEPAFVACDMGGTSFDACLVSDGVPALTRDRELTFGIPLAVEMLDIATIGAGGGSVVSVSSVGTVEVGPEGMGADPGPACYGRQVHRATVTDADLVLGRISSELKLPSGTRNLDVDAARKTLNERVAQPLGVSVEAAASLVLSTVEEKMADQIRQMGLKARQDVSDHILFAYGGAGPLHAAGIADPLGITRIVIPPNAGLFSAWGGLLTQPRQACSTASAFDLVTGEDQLKSVMALNAKRLNADIDTASHALTVRSRGSARSISLAADATESAPRLEERLRATPGAGRGPWIVTRVSTSIVGSRACDLPGLLPKTVRVSDPESTTRSVVFTDGRSADCLVLDRGALSEGDAGDGPCVIEEAGATTVVPSCFGWRVGTLGLLHLERNHA